MLPNLLEHQPTAPTVKIIGATSVNTIEKTHLLLKMKETRGKKLIMKVT